MTTLVLTLAVVIAGFSGASNAQDVLPQSPSAQQQNDPNAALLAQSAALSDADRERARALFSTGFQLWQASDFAAAELAFRDGLAIDPANAMANFYMGDALKRRNARAEARTYFERSIAFGPDAPEAYRARAGLAELAVAPDDPAQMTDEEYAQALVGHWTARLVTADGPSSGEFEIARDDTGRLFITGHIDANGRVSNLTLEGRTIRFRSVFLFVTARYEAELTDGTTMVGTWRINGSSPFEATRR